MSLEVEKKIPNITWFQTQDNIVLNIFIQKFNQNNIQINGNKLIINDSIYQSEFEFYEEINNEEELIFKETEKYLRVQISKKEPSFWNYLIKEHNRFKNKIKVDWDNWIDEDESEDEMDLQNMMGGMPGMMPPMDDEDMMGGMSGMMPPMDNDDNENEEIDDNLDNESKEIHSNE